ncbi:MAG: hypothetical protein Q9210_002119 [Variospora velana]
MGGLAISIPEDLPESKQFVCSWSCGTWSITGGGLRLLFNDDRETAKEEILSLSKEDIESKSKANGLAKSVTTLQYFEIKLSGNISHWPGRGMSDRHRQAYGTTISENWLKKMKDLED